MGHNFAILDELNASSGFDFASEKTRKKNFKKYSHIIFWKDFWSYANILYEAKSLGDVKRNLLRLASGVYNWLMDIERHSGRKTTKAQNVLYAKELADSEVFADLMLKRNGLCVELCRGRKIWIFYKELYLFGCYALYKLFGNRT